MLGATRANEPDVQLGRHSFKRLQALFPDQKDNLNKGRIYVRGEKRDWWLYFGMNLGWSVFAMPRDGKGFTMYCVHAVGHGVQWSVDKALYLALWIKMDENAVLQKAHPMLYDPYYGR